MKRIQLFEFEDFQWFPKSIRSGMTHLIKVFHNMLGTKETLSSLILDCRKKTTFQHIVDLGSGSGGAMLDTITEINKSSDTPLSLLLTDKFPNPNVVRSINEHGYENVRYQAEPQDAMEMNTAPEGLKTMIASFHHIPRSTAESILRSAEESKSPLLIYEIAENNVPLILWLLLLPISLTLLVLMSLFMTPFVKPLTLHQLIFTYIIPVVPLAYAWDGQASLVRTYTLDDIDILLGDRNNHAYTWEKAPIKNKKGKKAGYYVFGYPTSK